MGCKGEDDSEEALAAFKCAECPCDSLGMSDCHGCQMPLIFRGHRWSHGCQMPVSTSEEVVAWLPFMECEA